MKQAKTIWIAAAAGTLLCAAAQAQDTKDARPMTHDESGTINFDKDTVGKLPAGWKAAESRAEKAPGKSDDPAKPGDPGKEPGRAPAPGGMLKAIWAVASDPTAPTTPNVLELTGSVQAENGYNICICEKHSMKDVDLTAKLRANTGRQAQGGGLAWRVRNPENFYACAYNPSDGKFQVFKVTDGRTQELGAAEFKGSGPGASTWYTVSAKMTGDTITCSINGQELLHATDATIKDAGHIGVWARGDAGTSFDDVAINKAGEGEKEPKGIRPKDEPKPPKEDLLKPKDG